MAETIITIADLKNELTPQDYRTLTLGNDEVADRAINKAVIWVKGKVLSTGNAYDETNEVITECVLKRAVYELFVYAGYESKAKAKEEDAADLIESYYGNISTKGDSAGESEGPASGYMESERPPCYGG
jgi:hypothetical protein